MPLTVSHNLSATTPDDPTYEIQPKHWNSGHAVTFSAVGSEIIGAFSNLNGISFGTEAGGGVTASYTVPSVPAQSVQTQASGNIAGIGFTSTTTAGVDVKATHGSNGLSWANPAYITTARASTDAVGLNTALTANGVAWTVNSSGVSLNVPAFLTTARGSTDGIGLGTTQTNVTWTVNSNGISLNAGGYAGTGFTSTSTAGTDVKATNNTLGLSVAFPAYLTTQTVQTQASGNIPRSGFTTTATGGSVVVGTHDTDGLKLGVPAYLTTAQAPGAYLTTARASNDAVGLNTTHTNVTWTVNSSGISINAGGYAGTNTAMTGGSVTLNSSGISINIAPAAGATNSYYPFLGNNYIQGTTAITSLGKSTVLVQPLFLPEAMSMSYVRVPASINFGNAGSGTTAGRSWTIRQTDTYWVNFYSLGVGGNSRSLQYVTGSSTAVTASVVYSIGAASNNQTLVHAITLPTEGAAITYNTTINPNSASFTYHTTHLSNSFVGNKWIDVDCAVSLSAGAWWVGIARSSATASTSSGGDFTQVTLITSQGSLYGVSQINTPIQPWGRDTSASTGAAWQVGLGAWSTDTFGRTSASMALSHIVSVVNQPMFPMIGVRQV